MNRDLCNILLCSRCSAQALRLDEYAASGAQIHEGRLVCTKCGTWFRIEKGVADLLPPHLRRTDLCRQFAERHGVREIADGEGPAEEFKASQIRFFKSHVAEYEAGIVHHPLYTAFNEHSFLKWIAENLRRDDWILDLGCGTGAPCIDLAHRGFRVLGVDIAEEMLAVGQERASLEHLDDRIDFIVADAENPPIADSSFKACILLGALHHLPDPAKAIAGAARKVMANGYFYSQDPHKSPVRFLFDWLMKVKKLYDEEARDEPLFREQQLQDWMRAAGFEGRTRLSIYLPPHVFGLMSSRSAKRVLEATDAVLGMLPGIRRCAGYVIAQGVKKG